MADATVKNIREFFGIPAGTLMKEWKELTDADKEQIRAAIGSGTLTY